MPDVGQSLWKKLKSAYDLKKIIFTFGTKPLSIPWPWSVTGLRFFQKRGPASRCCPVLKVLITSCSVITSYRRVRQLWGTNILVTGIPADGSKCTLDVLMSYDPICPSLLLIYQNVSNCLGQGSSLHLPHFEGRGFHVGYRYLCESLSSQKPILLTFS